MINLATSPEQRIGAVVIRPRAREVAGPHGSEVLEPRVMQVLVALAEARGGVVTREELTERCWGGRVVGEDALQRVVARIRRLSDTVAAGSFKLDTVVKVGYRLIELQPVAANDDESRNPTATPQHRSGPHAQRRRWPIAVAIIAVLLIGALVLSLRAKTNAAQRTVAAQTADLRRLANYSLTQLNGDLVRVAGNTRARAGLAEQAQRTLSTLAASPGADETVKAEAARGLITLARAQGVPSQPNLGERELARSNLKRAIAILRAAPGKSPASRADLANGLAALAMIQAHGDADVRAATATLAEAEAALTQIPVAARDPRWHGAWRQVRLGQIEVATVNQEPAELKRLADLFAADIAARPAALRNARETALDRAYLGYYRGQHALFAEAYPQAVALLQQSEAMFTALDRSLPNDPLALFGLMWNSYVGYGAASALPTERKEEARFLALALRTNDRLRALEANDAQLRSFAASLRLAQGQALSTAGNHAEAMAMLRSVVALHQAALGTERPTRTLNRLATSQVTLGNIARVAGDRAAACAAYQAARDLIAELDRRGGLLGTVGVFRTRIDGNMVRCADGVPVAAMAELS